MTYFVKPTQPVYFIYVSGAYDAVYIGPFGTAEAASHAIPGLSQFDYEIRSDKERDADQDRYGEIPLVRPADFIKEYSSTPD